MPKLRPDTGFNQRCTRCGIVKTLDEFPPQKDTRNGRGSWCRACMVEAVKEWRHTKRLRSQ